VEAAVVVVAVVSVVVVVVVKFDAAEVVKIEVVVTTGGTSFPYTLGTCGIRPLSLSEVPAVLFGIPSSKNLLQKCLCWLLMAK
jgi:hypothetical protein